MRFWSPAVSQATAPDVVRTIAGAPRSASSARICASFAATSAWAELSAVPNGETMTENAVTSIGHCQPAAVRQSRTPFGSLADYCDDTGRPLSRAERRARSLRARRARRRRAGGPDALGAEPRARRLQEQHVRDPADLARLRIRGRLGRGHVAPLPPRPRTRAARRSRRLADRPARRRAPRAARPHRGDGAHLARGGARGALCRRHRPCRRRERRRPLRDEPVQARADALLRGRQGHARRDPRARGAWLPRTGGNAAEDPPHRDATSSS